MSGDLMTPISFSLCTIAFIVGLLLQWSGLREARKKVNVLIGKLVEFEGLHDALTKSHQDLETSHEALAKELAEHEALAKKVASEHEALAKKVASEHEAQVKKLDENIGTLDSALKPIRCDICFRTVPRSHAFTRQNVTPAKSKELVSGYSSGGTICMDCAKSESRVIGSRLCPAYKDER